MQGVEALPGACRKSLRKLQPVGCRLVVVAAAVIVAVGQRIVSRGNTVER